MDADSLTRLLADAGACAVAFAPLEPVDDSAWESYLRWLADGRHASMAYLENHAAIRRNPALLLDDGPQPGGTVVCMAFAYPSDVTFHPGALRIARYALGDDYHETLRARLRPVADAILTATGHAARICVDSAPILERYWAIRSGLGFAGRNRQIIVPGAGSHLFLAEIVTRARFTPCGTPLDIGCPEGCDRCMRACPGGALAQEGGIDARRCLSFHTIENKGEIPTDMRIPPLRFYGCDICLEACPLSKPARPVTILPEFMPREPLLRLTSEAVAALTPGSYATLLHHSPIKRASLAGLLRNLNALKR